MSCNSTPRRIRGLVAGRVQGVYYRASLQKQARALQLVGFVRNLSDGRVEYQATGESGRIEQLIEWSRRGPPFARVTEVDIEELADGGNSNPEDSGDDFTIVY